jgi:hypothetical protein
MDPDPSFHFDPETDTDPLIIKVMQPLAYRHGTQFHFERLRLHL